MWPILAALFGRAKPEPDPGLPPSKPHNMLSGQLQHDHVWKAWDCGCPVLRAGTLCCGAGAVNWRCSVPGCDATSVATKEPGSQTRPKNNAVALTPRASEIARLGHKYDWVPEQEQRNIGLIILVRGTEQVNVYYTKMTVGTCVDHPTKGKTQLFRRNVSMAQLEMIFQKPRVHSSKTGLVGYRKRR